LGRHHRHIGRPLVGDRQPDLPDPIPVVELDLHRFGAEPHQEVGARDVLGPGVARQRHLQRHRRPSFEEQAHPHQGAPQADQGPITGRGGRVRIGLAEVPADHLPSFLGDGEAADEALVAPHLGWDADQLQANADVGQAVTDPGREVDGGVVVGVDLEGQLGADRGRRIEEHEQTLARDLSGFGDDSAGAVVDVDLDVGRVAGLTADMPLAHRSAPTTSGGTTEGEPVTRGNGSDPGVGSPGGDRVPHLGSVREGRWL
jgi:hypothetical protein